ncbi:MAG: hypothetical protein ACTS4U_01560 [Candidatus Hodgkinia cicadicola]
MVERELAMASELSFFKTKLADLFKGLKPVQKYFWSLILVLA